MNQLLLGIAWLLLSATGFAAVRSGLRLRRRILSSWAQTKAAIVRSEVISSRYALARPVVTYEYDAGGHHFLGQWNPWGWCCGPRPQAEESAARYLPGTMFSVFVDPDDHQVSLLRPWPSLWLCVMLGGLSLLAFIFGASLIISGLRLLGY